ncbi:MAG: hypothetical protein LBV19_07025 [Streptococcaceae bacterium]|jgi:hypothetical protein|nr:hypothetical protein [Streptococcaceae bacterium]
MFEKAKEELDKGMPVISYIKKNYGFDSVAEFEAYIAKLKEKADKYDLLLKEGKE